MHSHALVLVIEIVKLALRLGCRKVLPDLIILDFLCSEIDRIQLKPLTLLVFLLMMVKIGITSVL